METSGRALIFDMDGVLIDSEPLHLLAYQELLQRFGRTFSEEDNRQYLGMKDIEIAAVVIEKLGLELTAKDFVDEKEGILERFLKIDPKPQPGVLSLLARAHEMKIPLAIASSATLPTIKLVVQTLNIGSFFQTLTSGDEVRLGKPAPDVYLLAAERLRVKPQNCLVIEDTHNGVKAAKAAGMQCLAVPCLATKHEDHSHADTILQSLEDFDVEQWYSEGSLVSCR